MAHFNVLNESCAIFRGTRFVSVNGVHNVRGGGGTNGKDPFHVSIED